VFRAYSLHNRVWHITACKSWVWIKNASICLETRHIVHSKCKLLRSNYLFFFIRTMINNYYYYSRYCFYRATRTLCVNKKTKTQHPHTYIHTVIQFIILLIFSTVPINWGNNQKEQIECGVKMIICFETIIFPPFSHNFIFLNIVIIWLKNTMKCYK